MLDHQLPSLPPVASFWEALPEFFLWLLDSEAFNTPAAYRMAEGESVIRERTLRIPVGGRSQSYLEVIRFSAANRLCVDFDYVDEKGRFSTRAIETYSLRRTSEDNIILHAWDVSKNVHRSFRVDRIQGTRTTSRTFTPRYEVELTPSGPVSIPQTERHCGGGFGGGGVSRSRSSKRTPRRTKSTFGSSPTYVYQCGMCGKKFNRKKMDGRDSIAPPWLVSVRIWRPVASSRQSVAQGSQQQGAFWLPILHQHTCGSAGQYLAVS